ncbi:MAG: hypothetical protein PHE09_00135 [Oscillospiraceae bacterium]|nr:hypothetical protein [Oscillospiraceae bacterium]
MSKQTRLNFCSRIALIIVGTLCILRSTHILYILPELLGSAMLFSSIGMVFELLRWQSNGMRTQECTDGIARAILLFLLGFITMIQGEKAIPFIGVSWGILGLIKGGRSLAAGLSAFFQQMPRTMLFLKAIAQITLAFVLLFYPAEKVRVHIILLGLQIIFYAAVRATGPLPTNKAIEELDASAHS